MSRTSGGCLTAAVLGAVLWLWALHPGARSAVAAEPAVPQRPIIAELFWDARSFEGRSVAVYGLVIATGAAGRVFTLQDVSQMPLRVEVTDGTAVWVGDQLLVEGVVVVSSEGDPCVQATKIVPTKVLGGGGCC